MNKDEKFFEENFHKIIPLINYDFEKNKINAKTNLTFFTNFYYKKKDTSDQNIEDNEKIKITLNFYKYLCKKENLEKFLEIYAYLSDNKPWFYDNTYLNTFFEKFDDRNISILFYSNMILKTLINPSYYRKSIYDESGEDIKNVDSWHNSTNVLQNQFNLINQYIVYNDIKINLKEKNTQVFSNLFKFINNLIKKKIIKERMIKFRSGNNKFKTIKFWSILEESDLQDFIIDSNFSKLPYKIITHYDTTYEKGLHYSKIIHLFRENWYSGEKFYLKEEKYINKILNLKLYINKDFMKKILSKIEIKENIKTENLEDLIKKESTNLKKIFNKDIILEKDLDEIKKIQKKTNKLIDLIRIKKIIDWVGVEYLYLPIFFDFRGRSYFDDYISPTFSKLTRLSFFYGYYEKVDLDSVKIDLIEPYMNQYIKKKISDIIKEFNIPYENYAISTIFWVLIGIGKNLIEKNKTKTSLESFIREGSCYVLNKKRKELKLKDEMEVIHYLDIIESLNKEKIKKRVILKDATASVIQNLIKILGPKDQDSLNLANLGDSNYWYDPYSHILNKFKNSFVEEKKEIMYFNRNTIKKTIMTTPYSAGENTCWKYFKEEVIKEFSLKEEELEKIHDIYKIFYNFVRDFFEEIHLFKNPSKAIIKHFKEVAEKEKKIVLNSEDSTTNLAYFKLKTSYIDIKNDEGLRLTKKIKKIDKSKIDNRKIYNSIRANIAHWLDAMFLRKLVNSLKNPIFTIHDEFAIDFLSVNELIVEANQIASEELLIKLPWDFHHDLKIFSIFILI
jgi:hypothetical protein